MIRFKCPGKDLRTSPQAAAIAAVMLIALVICLIAILFVLLASNCGKRAAAAPKATQSQPSDGMVKVLEELLCEDDKVSMVVKPLRPAIFPIIPLTCLIGIISGAIGMGWYWELSEDDQAAVDEFAARLAHRLYNKALDQLLEHEANQVIRLVTQHFRRLF